MLDVGNRSDHLSSNMEDYLEAILRIVRSKQAARAKDIADEMGVSASSVTGALHTLSERDLVNYAPYDIVTLTDEGDRIARHVTERHAVLLRFFEDVLHLDHDQADVEACQTEHAMSAKSIERLSRFLKFLESRPDIQHQWDTGGNEL